MSPYRYVARKPIPLMQKLEAKIAEVTERVNKKHGGKWKFLTYTADKGTDSLREFIENCGYKEENCIYVAEVYDGLGRKVENSKSVAVYVKITE